jgi:hypothetical protein
MLNIASLNRTYLPTDTQKSLTEHFRMQLTRTTHQNLEAMAITSSSILAIFPAPFPAQVQAQNKLELQFASSPERVVTRTNTCDFQKSDPVVLKRLL